MRVWKNRVGGLCQELFELGSSRAELQAIYRTIGAHVPGCLPDRFWPNLSMCGVCASLTAPSFYPQTRAPAERIGLPQGAVTHAAATLSKATQLSPHNQYKLRVPNGNVPDQADASACVHIDMELYGFLTPQARSHRLDAASIRSSPIYSEVG